MNVLRAKTERKAALCVKLANALLPPGEQYPRVIEAVALKLMDTTQKNLKLLLKDLKKE